MFLFGSLWALLCTHSLSPTHAKSTTTNLNVVNKIISPDGFYRSAVLAGGTFPGPLIQGFKGDRFQINVIDSLTDASMLKSTSIHWHGIFQTGSSWADGTSFVTQCPITSNHSFLYDFSVNDQAGTFWYHSHLATQYCDGLRGPFVIYDPLDPLRHLYDVDDESTIITLADWYHQPAPEILLTATPASTLINGKGRFDGGPLLPLAVVDVRRDIRYRFRLISLSCYSRFNFSIDGHSLTIIEADGINTTPLVVDSIDIFAGQRYSFILTANRPVENYWIRVNTDRGTSGFENGINSAILRYHGARDILPTTQSDIVHPFNETSLHPLSSSGVPGRPEPGGADVLINLNLGLNSTTFLALVNGVTFVPPSVPVLLQILSGAQNAQDLLPNGSFYALPRNKVIEVSIPGGLVDGPHPFHLHGHAFDVVRSAGSSEYNFVNPVRRDVVSIGQAGDNVTFRFVTDNPGPWFLHCHLDWHLELGLAVVFVEDQDDIGRNPVPLAWKDLCPNYDSLSPDQQ